jgi:hypothetical protein
MMGHIRLQPTSRGRLSKRREVRAIFEQRQREFAKRKARAGCSITLGDYPKQGQGRGSRRTSYYERDLYLSIVSFELAAARWAAGCSVLQVEVVASLKVRGKSAKNTQKKPICWTVSIALSSR